MSKILLFTEIYNCGGIDTFILNLINSWPKKEDSFVLIANENYPGLQIIEENLKHRCEIIRYRNRGIGSLFSKNNISKLFFIVFFRYVLIFYNVLAFRKLVLQNNSNMLMVINGGYPGGDCCRAFSICWGLFSLKGTSIHNYHNLVQKAAWYLFVQDCVVDWLVARYTLLFVTVSAAAAKSMSVRPSIRNRHTISFIHNGIADIPTRSLQQQGVRSEIQIPQTAPLCLMLGTYELRKGHYFLLKAFAKVLISVPEARLLICGHGSQEKIEVVNQYLKELSLSGHVHLKGFRRDVANLISNSDVLLVPSQEYESFGYTSIEAMAHRVPVVATNVGGIPEVVVNHEGGYCVSRYDIDAFAQSIVFLLQNRELRVEQGQKGFVRFKKFFTAEVMSAKYANIIYRQR